MKLPLLLLLAFTGIQKVWRGCELERLGCRWFDCVVYTAGLWTLDNVTTLLLICCTWGLWTAPGMTVAGVICWKRCCWPAEGQSEEKRQTWHCEIRTTKAFDEAFLLHKITDDLLIIYSGLPGTIVNEVPGGYWVPREAINSLLFANCGEVTMKPWKKKETNPQ